VYQGIEYYVKVEREKGEGRAQGVQGFVGVKNKLDPNISRTIVSLKTDPQTDLEVILYLEDSFNRIKNLIGDIIRNEPSLNT
jgi:hypothetical protein